MGFLWDFQDISMIFLLDSYDISMRSLCRFKKSMVFPLIFPEDFLKNSVRFQKGFFGISMLVLWDFCWIPVGFPWYFYDISLGLLLDFYGMSVVFL